MQDSEPQMSFHRSSRLDQVPGSSGNDPGNKKELDGERVNQPKPTTRSDDFTDAYSGNSGSQHPENNDKPMAHDFMQPRTRRNQKSRQQEDRYEGEHKEHRKPRYRKNLLGSPSIDNPGYHGDHWD